MLLKIHCYLIFLKDKYAQDNGICKILYCSIVKKKKKKIHKVMLSDVIVNIFNSHMTLYLNIMKAQGFYILLRLFLFSQNKSFLPQGFLLP